MKKIKIHPSLTQQIAKEFNVSEQTVRMSLDYVFNSPKSEAIRERAKELLQEQIDNINENQTENEEN